MNKTERYLDPWEAEYGVKGRLWRRETTDLPTFTKGKWVLELGCGDGKTLIALAKQDIQLVGLDISITALGLAKDSLTRNGRKALLINGESTALPFVDGTFGTVLAYHILDHLLETDRRATIKEAIRVTEQGGNISFRGFSEKDLRSQKGAEIEEGTVERGRGLLYHYFRLEEVKAMFSLEGLKVGSVKEVSWNMGGNDRLRRTVIHGTFEKP